VTARSRRWSPIRKGVISAPTGSVDRRGGAGRLRVRARRPRTHWCCHGGRGRGRGLAGAGARTAPDFWRVVVGVCEPAGLGGWLAGDLVCDHGECRRAVPRTSARAGRSCSGCWRGLSSRCCSRRQRPKPPDEHRTRCGRPPRLAAARFNALFILLARGVDYPAILRSRPRKF
jgi:hypothetical protein